MCGPLTHYGQRILLSAAAAALALAACEAVLRAVGYYYSPFAIHIPEIGGDARFKHVFEDTCFEYDPQLIWRPRPNRAMFNAQGFRGRELSREKPAGEFRIFTIGDSNTIGWPPGGADHFHGANWPQYLEQHLAAETGDAVAVVNAGVWGYSSFQGVEQVKRILAYQPDLVLVSFGGNDCHKFCVPDAQFNAAVFRSPLFNLRTGQLVKAAWDRCTRPSADTPEQGMVFRVSLDEYCENLRCVVQICRERGVRCALLTRPVWGHSTHQLCWKTHARAYGAATIAVGEEQHVHVVDVQSQFADKQSCFADESHFTEEGHRLAAAFIFSEILPLVR